MLKDYGELKKCVPWLKCETKIRVLHRFRDLVLKRDLVLFKKEYKREEVEEELYEEKRKRLLKNPLKGGKSKLYFLILLSNASPTLHQYIKTSKKCL